MITLVTYRQYVEAAVTQLFPYIDLLKKTKINNVRDKRAQSDEFLSVVAINCIIAEIQRVIERKLVNTKGVRMKFDFTDAQGVILYKLLFQIPVPPNNVWLKMMIADWIGQLDQEMILNQIYFQNQFVRTDAATTTGDYFED